MQFACCVKRVRSSEISTHKCASSKYECRTSPPSWSDLSRPFELQFRFRFRRRTRSFDVAYVTKHRTFVNGCNQAPTVETNTDSIYCSMIVCLQCWKYIHSAVRSGYKKLICPLTFSTLDQTSLHEFDAILKGPACATTMS